MILNLRRNCIEMSENYVELKSNLSTKGSHLTTSDKVQGLLKVCHITEKQQQQKQQQS